MESWHPLYKASIPDFMMHEETITGLIGQLPTPSRLGVKTSREPISALLDSLGHPEGKFRSMYVDGTAGKFAPKKHRFGVLSFSQGHHAQSTLAPLLPLLDTIILTEFNIASDDGNKSAQSPQEIAAMIRGFNSDIDLFLEPDPDRAIETAQPGGYKQPELCNRVDFPGGSSQKIFCISRES